jgi:hypothetical protein
VALNSCQKAVQRASAKFVTGEVKAVSTCLQAISQQLVQKGAVDASGAAKRCVTQLRKLNDSRGLGKSVPEKFQAAITKGCAGVQNVADILGPDATVAQPLGADNIATWCANFGGNGALAGLSDWVSCIENAQGCGVDTQLSTLYPQALAWLGLVKSAMNNLTAPAGDPTQVGDALAGLDAVVAGLAGTGSGTAPQFQCGDNGVCDGELATCNSNLSTCNANSSGCSSSLATCNANYASCSSSLTTCNASLTSTQGQLSTCNASLSSYQTALDSCASGLSTTTKRLIRAATPVCRAARARRHHCRASSPPVRRSPSRDR